MNFRTKITASSLALIFFVGLLMSMFGLEVKATEEIRVKIDGQEISFSQAPLMSEGRVLVPLRGIFEEMGAVVTWYKEEGTVEITKGEIKITLKIGSQVAFKNNKAIHADVPPQIIKGTTYVPLRLISEAFDARVKWSNESKTVEIITLTIQTVQTVDQLFSILEFEDYELDIAANEGSRLNFYLIKDKLFTYIDWMNEGLYLANVYEAPNSEHVTIVRKVFELRGVPLGEDFEEMIGLALEYPGQLQKRQFGDFLVQAISMEGTNYVTISIGWDWENG